MAERVILELPEDLARRVRSAADLARRPVEEVLVEYIERGANDVPVSALSDADLLALCDLQMEEKAQEELHELLDRNREGELQPADRPRFDQLMGVYRRGLVRKAQALQEAVQRGLRGPVQ